MDAKVLTEKEQWTFMKFLATQDPKYLAEKLQIPVQQDDCDLALSSGDISTVRLNYDDALRIEGPTTRYARIA
ncbi:hypothetical protein, partial [Brachybacterium paraconglomeratum]|uniref:hypothetical protein n=1 Tax=Brachybacterium paraconglomeratum TaxID=173362 RepID=UPI0022AF3706